MAMRNIWAPWRMQYLESLDDDAEADAGFAPSSASPDSSDASAFNFLADYWAHPDQDATNFVVHRDAVGFILLNRYPYSNGHVLIALGDPRPHLLDYSPDQRAALWRLTDVAVDLVERALNPQGINVGVNQGRAAGAGVPHHLHVHVIPRWSGDTNFITVVGSVRVVPDSLENIYKRLRAVVRPNR